MKIDKYILLISAVIIFSCEKEDILTPDLNQQLNEKIELEEGVLSFISKDLLQKTVKSLKNKDNTTKHGKLKKFYDKGFKPLFPNYLDDDPKLSDFVKRKKIRVQKTKSLNTFSRSIPTDIDEDGELIEEYDDDLISDDEFASLLNDKREIIVNDTLYKYTYSGMFSVKKENKLVLEDYINDNNIEYLIPEPTLLNRGTIKVSSEITRSLPTIQELNSTSCSISDNYMQKSIVEPSTLQMVFNEDCSGGGSSGGGSSGGGSSGGTTTTVDHTQNLINYTKNLAPCIADTGAFHLWGAFGTTQKCYESFDSKYRTKTKFWKENYFVWKSIGVKVKHQKKGWTGFWRAKKTDEVALTISQATFQYSMPIPGFPQNYAPPKLFFFEGKIFNSQAQALTYYNAINKPPLPILPWESEVTIVEYRNDSYSDNLDTNNFRNYFYQGAWEGAKLLVQSQRNRAPKTVTHILYTPATILINHVDLRQRKLNSKKIVNVFDYNFNLGIKFNVYTNPQGNYTTDLGNFWGALGHLEIPKTYDYSKAKMDFIGVTRKGNTWKGDRIVYND